jgi:uncharacterized membrane protein
VTLLVSVSLNLLVGGILAGRLQHSPPAGTESRAGRLIERMAAVLPSDDGRILRTVYHTHQAGIGKFTADLRAARDEVRQVLRAEPFDQRALQTAFAQVRERRQAMHEAIHEVVAEAAPQFSPQGRRTLSDWRKDEQ